MLKPSEGGCEFCGKKKDTASTPFVGGYCRECHRLVIDESKEAIRQIIAERKAKKEVGNGG